MACNLKQQIISTYYKDYKIFFQKPNVQGIGFGYKYVNGICTCEPSIHVFVNKKVAKSCLSSNGLIPRLYKGIKTDVIETGNFTIDDCNCTNTNEPPKYVDKIRPIQAGYGVSIASPYLTGTFGYIVTDNLQVSRTYCLLGTCTTFAKKGNISIGSEIIQPSIYYGGVVPEDVVAKLLRFVPIKPSSNIPNSLEEFNIIDGAVASYFNVGEVQLLNPRIPGIGILRGITSPAVNKEIQWTGCISGNKKGSIISVSSIIKVPYGIFTSAYFKDIVIAGGDRAYSGDFGALVCDLDKKAMGMFFANTPRPNIYNAFCTINNIQSQLKVTLLTLKDINC